MAEPANSGKKPTAANNEAQKAEKKFDMFDCKYKRVIFQPKSNPNDDDRVILSVQGFCCVMQRGVETPAPDFLLEAADHATYAKYSVRPGEGRKVAARINKYPYAVVGDATREEFEKKYLEGTKKTRQAVATYGLKIPIEQAVAQEE